MNLPGFRKLRGVGGRLYRCEKGAEGIEKLLILGAIVLPILIALIFFKDRIFEWVGLKFEDVVNADDTGIVDP